MRWKSQIILTFARTIKKNHKPKHSTLMNKKTFLLALTLLCSAGFVTSCGDDDDDPKPNTEQDSKQNGDQGTTQRTSVFGTYEGQSKAIVHGATIETFEETIEIKKIDDNTVDISYFSPTWTAKVSTLKGVKMTKTDLGYTFTKPIVPTVNDEHTDWVFPDDVDYITMTKKGPNAGSDPQTKDYPFVLESGFISADFKKYTFNFAAYLNLNGAGIYQISYFNN